MKKPIRHTGDLSPAQKRCFDFCASNASDWTEFTQGDGSRPPLRITYDILLSAGLIKVGPSGKYVTA